jgi:hypothetical protein
MPRRVKILELNTLEYQEARIAQLLSRSESTIHYFSDKWDKEHVFHSKLGRRKKQDDTRAVITATLGD